ncbi:MAG: response regulator transcription factor [Lachnospiraceae bacterium]|nr:response regulator transcription factor [Lachnospiraceae bacterium]
MKIMLIDDDENISLTVKHLMEKDGYEFCCASDGTQVFSMLETEKPDLLILDVMLPGINGFDLCREIREARYQMPIIFLSAKGDIVDKSIGFKAGADDYLSKPFVPQELSLRVEALLRRVQTVAEESPLARKDVGRFGELEIFFNRYEARIQGKKVDLTSKEFEILAYMAAHPGQVFTRQQILEHIWGKEKDNDINTITVFIRKIREKIEPNPAKPRYIQTVWRVGYKFYE